MSRDSSPSCAVGESGLSDDAPAPSGSPQHFYATFEDKCTSGKGKVYAKHLSLLLDIGKQERKMGRRMDAKTAGEKWKEIMATIREKEECERKEWMELLKNEIAPHYKKIAPEAFPKVDSFKSLLELRVIPPILEALSSSARRSDTTESRERRYPPEIHSWSNFKESVQEYEPQEPPNLDLPEIPGYYHYSLFDSAKKKPLATEADEQSFLINVLESILATTNARPSIHTHASGLKGRPDFCMKRDEDKKPVLVGEMKSTQNLLLPELSSDVVSQYNQACKDVWESKPPEYPREFSNVCHPLAQLIEYMISNTCRYGILSSATRSYFCFVDGGPDKPYMCSVSDAFFVGEPNYIKAWVYMYDMGKKSLESSTALRPDWKVTSSKNRLPGTDSRKRTRDDEDEHNDRQDDKQSNGAGGNGDRKSGGGPNQKVTLLPISGLALPLPADCDGLPYVPEANLAFLESIGHGFHGTAFRVRVNGAEAAVKQFDANKDGVTGFLKEVSAYVQLKSVWGVLVPELLFVSESWLGNILYLGLQLGRTPEMVDYHEWQGVLSLLEKDYGVRHNDADDTHNTVLIPDKASSGGERLAIIDFEDCAFVKPS